MGFIDNQMGIGWKNCSFSEILLVLPSYLGIGKHYVMVGNNKSCLLGISPCLIEKALLVMGAGAS